MEVSFKPSFVKDFEDLPQATKAEVRKVCTEIFPPLKDLRELQGYRVEPLKGFKNYYRIRLRNLRIGFKIENHQVIFMRVRDRKDIYRHFP